LSSRFCYTLGAPVGDLIYMTAGYDHQTFQTTQASEDYLWVFQWDGAGAYDAHIHLVAINSGGGIDESADVGTFTGVTNGQTVAAGSVTTTAVTNDTLTITTTDPSGYTSTGTTESIVFSDGLQVFLPNVTTNPATFHVPTSPGLSSSFEHSASGVRPFEFSGAHARDITSGATPLTMTPPVAPAALTPTDHSVGVDVTTDSLSWSLYTPTVVSNVHLTDSATTTINIYSGSAKLDLARLESAGIHLRSAVAYSWGVTGYGPLSIDDYCGQTTETFTTTYQGNSFSPTFTTK